MAVVMEKGNSKLSQAIGGTFIMQNMVIYCETTELGQSWSHMVNLLQVLHLFLWFLSSLIAGGPSIKVNFPPIFNEIDGEPAILDGVPVTGSPCGSRTVGRET